MPEHSRIMRVEQREAPRVQHLDALGRPDAADRVDRDGKIALSKKAQNQARKNITSEAMNRIMP